MNRKNYPQIRSLTTVIIGLLGICVLIAALFALPSFQVPESTTTDIVYEAWQLAVLYRFEEESGGNTETHNQAVMTAVGNLRGDKLRYFLDSTEVINQIQRRMFPPGLSKEPQQVDAGITNSMTLAKEKHLVDIVTELVFSSGNEKNDLVGLSEGEQSYVRELQNSLTAIVEGDGDMLFSEEYLAYRTKVIQFIEETGVNLFDPSQEVFERFQNTMNSK